jgi:hypothetical protein
MFTPTALLVMQHNATGLKYFCKSSRLDELKYYKGSGKYWKRHRAKHGNDITVGVLGVYYDKQRCVEVAEKFSKEHNIANSKEWANLIQENGLDGAGLGEANHRYGKPSPCIGQKRPNTSAKVSGSLNGMWGKTSPMKGKKNIGASLALKGRKRPEGGGKKPHPVVKIEDNGTETIYKSVTDAAKENNVNRSSVHRCCTGKAKTGGGYKWKYFKEQVCHTEQ